MTMNRLIERIKNVSREKQDYIFNSPAHFARTTELDKVERILTDYDFIEAKISKLGPRRLVEDYDLVFAKNNPSGGKTKGNYSVLSLIRDAISLSAQALSLNPAQTAGQLTARLLSQKKRTIKTLLKQASSAQDKPWLRPLKASLIQAGSPLLRSFEGHSGCVYAIAISPDGRFLVSGADDNTVRIWDFQTEEELHRFESKYYMIRTVAITPDSRFIISAGSCLGIDNEVLILRDIQSGKEIRRFEWHKGSITCVAITPDNRFVISASYDKTLKVWNLETGK